MSTLKFVYWNFIESDGKSIRRGTGSTQFGLEVRSSKNIVVDAERQVLAFPFPVTPEIYVPDKGGTRATLVDSPLETPTVENLSIGHFYKALFVFKMPKIGLSLKVVKDAPKLIAMLGKNELIAAEVSNNVLTGRSQTVKKDAFRISGNKYFGSFEEFFAELGKVNPHN